MSTQNDCDVLEEINAYNLLSDFNKIFEQVTVWEYCMKINIKIVQYGTIISLGCVSKLF
mgnify:CR=1 FL=1